jgi:predicted RNase H-like HicB family nuclease
MNRTYTVVVERDRETGWLVGEVVELPGCYTQSPDMPGLEANLQEAVKAYLLTAGEDVEPAPEFVGTWTIKVAV